MLQLSPRYRAGPLHRLAGEIAMKVLVVLGSLVAMTATTLAADNSCLETSGSAKATRLVRECKSVSEATHPPCHVANPCAVIVEEIRHWCEINRTSRLNFKAFCPGYLASRPSG